MAFYIRKQIHASSFSATYKYNMWNKIKNEYNHIKIPTKNHTEQKNKKDLAEI